MKRVAIFAHYSSDSKIEDHVIYYLQGLNQVTDYIIFVSDSDIKESELQKIKNITTKSIAKHHGEYDFGSYKRGFIYAIENNLLQIEKNLYLQMTHAMHLYFNLQKCLIKCLIKN